MIVSFSFEPGTWHANRTVQKTITGKLIFASTDPRQRNDLIFGFPPLRSANPPPVPTIPLGRPQLPSRTAIASLDYRMAFSVSQIRQCISDSQQKTHSKLRFRPRDCLHSMVPCRSRTMLLWIREADDQLEPCHGIWRSVAGPEVTLKAFVKR